MRASIAAEAAGVPSVSVVCEGFERQAAATGRGHGFDELALAVIPGHVDAQSLDDLTERFVESVVPQIIAGLTATNDTAAAAAAATDRGADADGASPASSEPAALDVVATGTIDEINDVFVANGWSDGSPFLPPTRDRVEAFIAPSGLDPWRRLGVAKSSGRDLTIWSIAVNGVMAGCAPEHLPVLVAIAEILADPHYGAEHSGNTTGADALIILAGPTIAELGFNAGAGALREGTRANTTVGRWLRLYLRNVLGFTTDEHDKATFGNSTRVVLAEAMDVLAEIGWSPVSASFGFDADDDVATMARFNSNVLVGSVFGSTPEEIIEPIADGLARVSGWDLTHVYGIGAAQYRPLVILSPILARTFARAGWTQDDVRRGLFERARIPARRFEQLIGAWSNLTPGRRTLADLVAEGHLPAVFAESTEPDRLVPIVTEPDRFVVAVAGDPNRTNAYVFSNDGPHGDYTARRIDLAFSSDLVCEVPTVDERTTFPQ